MPIEKEDRRQFDASLRRWLLTVAAGLVLAAAGGLIQAGQIKQKIKDIEAKQDGQKIINKQVIINTEAVNNINRSLEKISHQLERIDDRQRQLMIKLEANNHNGNH